MRIKILGTLLTLIVFSIGMAHAQVVGRVLLAAGEVTAVRGVATMKLITGAQILDKDVLRTGATSNLQVRFGDDSLVSVRENSELRIEEFRFTGTEDGTERAFFNLVRGGLRAFTGLVGRSNNGNYRMMTNTAVIGIRGTDYVATLCAQGNCRNDDGSTAKDGLYGRVLGASHGTNRVNVKNDTDERQFGINENFYVADNKSLIQPLLAPPGFLSGKLESRSLGVTAVASGTSTLGASAVAAAAGSEQNVVNGTQQDSRLSTAPPLATGLTFVAPETTTAGSTVSTPLLLTPLVLALPTPTIGFLGAWSGNPPIDEGGGAFVTPSMLTLNGAGTVIGFNFSPNTTDADGTLITTGFGVAAAAPDMVGGDPAVNAHWGRWPSGTIQSDTTGTTNIPGGAHILYGDLAPPDVVAAKTGSFLLSQLGGTTPTNNSGGTLISGAYPNITLNFTARTGTVSPFNWSFSSGANFQFLSSGTGNILIIPGQGASLVVNGSQLTSGCTGGACLTGASAFYRLTGIFLGAQGNYLGVALGLVTGGLATAQGVKLYTCAPSC